MKINEIDENLEKIVPKHRSKYSKSYFTWSLIMATVQAFRPPNTAQKSPLPLSVISNGNNRPKYQKKKQVCVESTRASV